MYIHLDSDKMDVPVKIIAGSGYPRPINKTEKNLILKGLAEIGSNGGTIKVLDAQGRKAVCSVEPEELRSQIDSLVIIGKCQCGDPDCHTVQFQHFQPGCSYKIVETKLEDDRTMRIFINGENGLLSGLEIIRE